MITDYQHVIVIINQYDQHDIVMIMVNLSETILLPRDKAKTFLLSVPCEVSVSLTLAHLT